MTKVKEVSNPLTRCNLIFKTVSKGKSEARRRMTRHPPRRSPRRTSWKRSAHSAKLKPRRSRRAVSTRGELSGQTLLTPARSTARAPVSAQTRRNQRTNGRNRLTLGPFPRGAKCKHLEKKVQKVLREWKWDDFFPYLKTIFNPVAPFNSQKGAFALLEMLRSRKKYMPKMQNFLKITTMKTWHSLKNYKYI